MNLDRYSSESPLASIAVVFIGLSTAIYGTITGRASADAKTSLAYASLTQVGIVFVEVGIGWKSIAIAHVLGHATVRTLQFLRAPSMLHDYHTMHSAAGGDLSRTGKHLEDLFPERVQLWLFRWALDRGHLDTILDRWLIQPLMSLSMLFARFDGLGLEQVPTRHQEASVSIRSIAGQGNRRSTSTTPEPILQLQRQLQDFRSSQPGRVKLPDSLWQAAVELARQYGVWPVAHSLRLDYMRLKKRLAARGLSPKFSRNGLQPHDSTFQFD